MSYYPMQRAHAMVGKMRQQTKRRRHTLHAGLFLGDRQRVEEAVVGVAVDPGAVAGGCSRTGEELLDALDLVGQEGDGDDGVLQTLLGERIKDWRRLAAAAPVRPGGFPLRGRTCTPYFKMLSPMRVLAGPSQR